MLISWFPDLGVHSYKTCPCSIRKSADYVWWAVLLALLSQWAPPCWSHISRKWLSARTNVYFQYANMKNTYISMRNYVKHANYAYSRCTHYVLSLYELWYCPVGLSLADWVGFCSTSSSPFIGAKKATAPASVSQSFGTSFVINCIIVLWRLLHPMWLL